MKAWIVELETRLPARAAEVVALAKTSDQLLRVAAPLVKFRAASPPELPRIWEPGTYWVRLSLFGWIPMGKQAIVISYPASPAGIFALRDDGHSALVARWDHLITIQDAGRDCVYRDRVSIEAGWRTPFVWAFASLFYRHRQWRWRKLLAERRPVSAGGGA
ncbi:hypothetical protein [Ramlibacter rhizophilus]|uniref:SRPBCC family protein n=1 Tax=Ramlibacter rhizophilus TaxID=1781167 RepID=A0A4Z0C2A0_9BURK|nr:hypothetical protein [Ramlibacter rhizophilus]TFZ04600.1 hypothetical protein EZ242_02295 [Ramlibacter rhizophilus]